MNILWLVNFSTCQVGVIIRNSSEWFPLLFHDLVSTNIQCMFVQFFKTHVLH